MPLEVSKMHGMYFYRYLQMQYKYREMMRIIHSPIRGFLGGGGSRE